jgi:glycine/D-amino acid oxidase-like deaminating enzyme
MMVAFGTKAEMDMARAWRAQPDLDNDAVLLDAARLRARLPALSTDFPVLGGVWSDSDGFADPRRATPAIARGAMRKGAAIFQDCAVRRVLVERGRAVGVETERGSVRAGHVVLAGGIWNQILCAHLGVDLPQLYGFATATEVRAPGLPDDVAGVVDDCCFRPTPWGTHVVGPHLSLAPVTLLHLRNAWRFRRAFGALGHAIDLAPAPAHFRFVSQALRWRGAGGSPFERLRVLEPEIRRYSEWFALERIRAPFGLGPVELVRSWAGALATTPDNMPLLGAVETIGNLHVGSGMYYGFTFAPGMADHLSASILGRAVPFDGKPYGLSRFRSGPLPGFAP